MATLNINRERCNARWLTKGNVSTNVRGCRYNDSTTSMRNIHQCFWSSSHWHKTDGTAFKKNHP
eukprot:6613823-Pyramimonas_sp.AAC.1